MKNKDCVFCKIVNKEESSNIIYEDELVCCFLDIDPINEGHVFIVPKEHYHDVDDLDDETLLRITKLSTKLTKVIKKHLILMDIQLCKMDVYLQKIFVFVNKFVLDKNIVNQSLY